MGFLFKSLMVLLQVYFVTMNFSVENRYCRSPISQTQKGFLAKETFDFCLANNRLFLARPEWMRQATCVSAYCFWAGYVLVAFAAITESWGSEFYGGRRANTCKRG